MFALRSNWDYWIADSHAQCAGAWIAPGFFITADSVTCTSFHAISHPNLIHPASIRHRSHVANHLPAGYWPEKSTRKYWSAKAGNEKPKPRPANSDLSPNFDLDRKVSPAFQFRPTRKASHNHNLQPALFGFGEL